MATIDSAIKIAFTIMSSIQEQKYKAEVLTRLDYIQESLNRIADGIVRIEKKIDHGNAMLRLEHLYTSIAGAPADIKAYYEREEFTAWLNSDGKTTLPPEFIAGVKMNMKNDLIKIHDAVMGTVDPDIAPWINLHIDVKQFEELPTSLVENVFHYFTGHLLALQLKGLILISAIPDYQSTFADYVAALKGKMTAQGNLCQKIVNQFTDADSWWGNCENIEAVTFASRRVRINPGEPPPDNHILVGYEVIEENGVLEIKRYHGKVNSAGIVEDIQQSISMGRDIVEFPSAYCYIDITKTNLPPDHVIVDICFLDRYPIYPAGDDNFYRALGVNYVHTKMNPDGTLDYSQMRIDFLPGYGMFQAPPGCPPRPEYFTLWTKFASTPQMKDLTMNVPLTGIQFFPAPQGKINSGAKIDLHKNSFSE